MTEVKPIKDRVEAWYVAQNGYVQWRVDGKWKAAHRWVMEDHLGRELLPGERVHFIGSKDDLSLNNLRLTYPGAASKQARMAYLERSFEAIWEEMYEMDSERAAAFAKDLLHNTLLKHRYVVEDTK